LPQRENLMAANTPSQRRTHRGARLAYRCRPGIHGARERFEHLLAPEPASASATKRNPATT
jgi:hypothetical protein